MKILVWPLAGARLAGTLERCGEKGVRSRFARGEAVPEGEIAFDTGLPTFYHALFLHWRPFFWSVPCISRFDCLVRIGIFCGNLERRLS